MDFITITYVQGSFQNEATLNYVIEKSIKNFAKSLMLQGASSIRFLGDLDVVHKIQYDNSEEVYAVKKGQKDVYCNIATIKRTERFITIITKYFNDEEYIKNNCTINSICLN